MMVAVISTVPYITNKGLHTTIFKIDKPSDCVLYLDSQSADSHHCVKPLCQTTVCFFTMVSLYLDLQLGQDFRLPHEGAYS